MVILILLPWEVFCQIVIAYMIWLGTCGNGVLICRIQNYYANSPKQNPTRDLSSGSGRIARGGSWLNGLASDLAAVLPSVATVQIIQPLHLVRCVKDFPIPNTNMGLNSIEVSPGV